MFDKQARFWIGEFDGEKECAAGNEVSAITRHRIFVFGLSVGEGMACCLRFLTSLKLALSDDIGGRLKALASTKLKRQTVNQATACVRTAHTLHLNLKVCVARSGRVCGLATHAVDRGAGYGLLPRLPYLSANSPLMMAEVGTCMMVLLVSGWTVGGF